MPYTVVIPADKVQAEDSIRFMLRQGLANRNPEAIRWWIAKWYMRGVRNFKDLNYQNGTIQISYMNAAGTLKFQYEDIVSKYQAQLGRLLGINLEPRVTKEGVSLEGMRKASIGQIVLTHNFPSPKVDQIQMEMMSTLLHYGTIALFPWTKDGNQINIEVAPPWELIPIPIDVDNPFKIRGLIRQKLVPLKWIQELPNTPAAKAPIYDEMESIEVPVGAIPAEGKNSFQGSVALGISEQTATTFITEAGGSKKARSPKSDDTKVKVVRVAEVWTKDSEGYWLDYILYAGGKVLYRADKSQEKKQFPPQIVSDILVGGFWGRSFIDTLIPLNSEMEDAIARQFQNVKDWDLYGLIYEPTTTGVPAKVMRGKDGLKRVRYEPDPISPDHKPYNIDIGKSGLLPAKIVEMGSSLQNSIANQPAELLGGGAPGRVDSASGLGFLFETSNVPLHPTAKQCARAMSNCYRVALDIMREQWEDDKVLDITHLDDAVAGINVNQETGSLTLAKNSIPHPDEVTVTVASEIPKSKEQMKIELKDALSMGIITPTEYRVKAREESLELPVGNEAEWQNWRRAKLENILLFGDGVTPGKMQYSDNDMHMIHLMVLLAFMAKPEFFLASPEVRTVFGKHKTEHEAGMGQLPDQIDYAEDAAAGAVGAVEGGPPPGV